jgi:hypothetical protein
MTSPFYYHTGLGAIVGILLLTIFTSIATLIVSALLLSFYRRAVGRLMREQTGTVSRTTRSEVPRKSDVEFEQPTASFAAANSNSVYSKLDSRDQRFRLAISGPWRNARKYALAGTLFALLLGSGSYLAFSQTQINYLHAASHPLMLAFFIWTIGWPIVLTTNLVATIRSRYHWLVLLIYFAILISFIAMLVLTPTEKSIQAGNITLAAWSGETPIRLGAKWILFNLPATILFYAFRNRRVRAVGPIVLSFIATLATGLLIVIIASFVYIQFSAAVISFISTALRLSLPVATVIYFSLLFSMGCAFFGALGWHGLRQVRRRYASKATSDQSLEIHALWTIFACFDAAILAFAGPGWILIAVVAFFAFTIAVKIRNRQFGIESGSHGGPALLVLRVFSLGKRSNSLFDAITNYWRYVGDVRLIAGIDLALSTVAPPEFLAFVSGKLDQLFVREKSDLLRGFAQLDVRPDQDGRFRINEFFCHADTWQSALSILIKTTDVVLMDLRKFGERNAGCVFEIKVLLNFFPLERSIFIVDDTTNKSFLTKTVAEIWNDLGCESPNRRSQSLLFQPFELGSPGPNNLRRLLRRLCTAVP